MNGRAGVQRHVKRVLRSLEQHGLLLVQSKSLPSLVALVAGESPRGSWWNHPQSHTIFQVLGEVAEHPEVVTTKLVMGKVTLVHRRLWAALLAVATAREPWQLRGLSPASRRLLQKLETEPSVVASGPAVKELEKKLLERCEQVHTESGAHRLRVEPWEAWARRVGCRPLSSLSAARQQLVRAVTDLGGDASDLPWSERRR